MTTKNLPVQLSKQTSLYRALAGAGLIDAASLRHSQHASGFTSYEHDGLSADTVALLRKIEDLTIGVAPSELQPASGRNDVSESLFDATARAKILTSKVAMHLDRVWREKLFMQIDSLHDIDQWDEEDRPVTEQSFATFLKAICLVKPLRRPGLGLSRTGNLIASWSIGRDDLIIEFFPWDRIRWVLSKWNGDQADRLAGSQSVSGLVGEMGPPDLRKWMGDAG